jgi:hypothetical protein
MYLNGTLKGNEIKDVTALPIEAIVGSNSVYMVQDSTIREKQIDIVLRTGTQAIVKGINPTDLVIIKGLNSLSPGQKAALQK